ncbi:MAG: T9SS type A sorting domain-containing protein [Proteobacteria bacterium]|nr:T9SS type A sorting domain-containing protein [Pseudomonadota bacterium]
MSIASRIRPAYGVDIAWRESMDPGVQDQSILSIMSTTIPYTTVGVQDQPTPESFSLFESYPNPFNPSTTLEFALPIEGPVTLTIYDAMGREVKTLVNEVRAAGQYTERWDATDSRNERVASGLYFSRLTTASGAQTIKMVLIK